MESYNIVVKFTGALADEHRLPAYEAAHSLEGVVRSIVIPANYLFEGRLRKRRFQFKEFDLQLVEARRGSFEFVYELIYWAPVTAAAAAVGAAVGEGAKEFIKEFTQTILKRATGQSGSEKIEKAEEQGKLKSGDMAALVDAVEPALKQAHRSIGNGATNIVIIQGDGNNVNFNSDTKSYIHNTIPDSQIRTRTFSISGYSADSGYGRAFDLSEFRKVAFELDADADAESVSVILQSMRHYAMSRFGNRGNSAIELTYRGFHALDGQLKKMKVLRARPARTPSAFDESLGRDDGILG